MNKPGVSRRWFIKTTVEHFKNGVLRKITNIAEKGAPSMLN